MIYGALEAGGTKMVCAVGDENGKILEQISIPTTTPAETMPQIIAYFRGKGIAALGVGCFGPIDLNRDSKTYGYITSTPKLAWRDYNIAGTLKAALGIPVGFDTDVNGSLLGEVTWGCAKGLHDAMYLTVGTGIGAGIMSNGKLLHGMLHPEFGHMLMGLHPWDLNGLPKLALPEDAATHDFVRPASSRGAKNLPQMHSRIQAAFGGICPYHGACMEGLASGPAIEARWGRKAAKLKDCAQVWELESYYLGQALANGIMALSPQKIILGGGVMHQEQLLPLIRRQVTEQLNGYLNTKELADMDHYIVPASLHDNQGIMGALKLGMDEAAEVECKPASRKK